MSTMSTTGLYAEDLHGTNPANLVTDDIQTLQVPGGDDYYFIIPKAAPYFADSLKVYNYLTGEQYVENDDYLMGHYFIEAMESIGRPICGSIRFMKRTIQGQARLEYRTIGGQWGFSDQAILAELSNRQNNPLIRSWAQIDVLPALFPPMQHTQPVNSLVGSAEILAALENLADIMQASAEGATQSHLEDFSNPHRVTATQVQLGNVPNFEMASGPDAIAGIRSDLFISPRGVFLQIQDKALIPLNEHINETGNVHGLVAGDINLGNVPNFPKAQPADAIDITNDITLMTPYTSALLIESLSPGPRIDGLENLIKDHIADTNNPHQLTPAILGMYSNQELDARFDAIGAGSTNALTFGGKTPEEWEDEFVSTEQGDEIVTNVTTATDEGTAAVRAAVITSDYTEEEAAAYQRTLVGSVTAGYDSYMVTNANAEYRVVSSSASPVIPDVLYKGADSYATAKDAVYVLADDGSISAYGPGAIPAPVGWRTGTLLPANRCDAVWCTGNKVWMRKWVEQPEDGTEVYGALYSYTSSTGTPVVVVTAAVGGVAIHTSSQSKYLSENTVIERRNSVFVGAGATAWVTAVNAAIAQVQNLSSDTIRDCCIGDDYVIFTTAATGEPYIYQMVRTGVNVTSLVRVTAPVFRLNGKPVTTLQNTTWVTGNYGHFSILQEDGTVAFFGDYADGQAAVDNTNGPYLMAAAGRNFTVTVNDKHQVQYWGNSPDNSMLYGNRGISLVPPVEEEPGGATSMISLALLNAMYASLRAFGTTIAGKFTSLGERLNEMEDTIRKVELLSPDDIGLGKVNNYSSSTLDDAKEAISNSSNMTPRRTRDYAEVNIFGPIGTSFKNATARLS